MEFYCMITFVRSLWCRQNECECLVWSVGVPVLRRPVARNDACLRLLVARDNACLRLENEVAVSTLTAKVLRFWISRLSAR